MLSPGKVILGHHAIIWRSCIGAARYHPAKSYWRVIRPSGEFT